MEKNKNLPTIYEGLLDSFLIRCPKYNRFAYLIFNPFIVAAIIMIAITVYIKISDGDWSYAVIVGAMASMFMSMKIALVGMQMTGHGVGLIKKGRLSVLGFPNVVVVMLGMILFLLLAITIIGYTAPERNFERIQLFGTSMLFGFIMSLLSWRLHTYYNTWYASEYLARMEFMSKGYSDEEIEERVKKLKEKGILI